MTASTQTFPVVAAVLVIVLAYNTFPAVAAVVEFIMHCCGRPWCHRLATVAVGAGAVAAHQQGRRPSARAAAAQTCHCSNIAYNLFFARHNLGHSSRRISGHISGHVSEHISGHQHAFQDRRCCSEGEVRSRLDRGGWNWTCSLVRNTREIPKGLAQPSLPPPRPSRTIGKQPCAATITTTTAVSQAHATYASEQQAGATNWR